MKLKIGKLKVVFILENGQKLIVKCKKFSMSKLSGTKGSRELKIEGADRVWSVDLDKVVGVTAKWCLYLFILLFLPVAIQAQEKKWHYEQPKFKEYAPSAALIFLAGMSDGLRDASLFYHIKNGGFWDGRNSFNRKYKNGDYRQGAAFPLSTSLLVWTTDGPHLAATATHVFDAWGEVMRPIDTNRRFGHLCLQAAAIFAVRAAGHYVTYDLIIKNQNR